MKKLLEQLGRARTFLADVHGELRKSSWPSRGELLESTMMVILSVVFFSVFVGLSDSVLVAFVKLLAR